jgi:hypothetical protein
MNKMYSNVLNHIKNIPGWRTKRKLVLISVDDYGNVRLDSKKARENMDRAGLKVHSRFDAYDTLETREDLEALYEVLTSVKDKNGNHAVFTPFALPCNINFEAMKEEGYKSYIYELLPETYSKLAASNPNVYKGTWQLWQEGIDKGLLRPQLHGREHFNVAELEIKLAIRDKEVLTSLGNRSYTSISGSKYSTRSWAGAFTFWDEEENTSLKKIAKDGYRRFEEVYGYKPTHFMAPTARVSDSVLEQLADLGILVSDKPLVEKNHIDQGEFEQRYHFTGKKHLKNLKLIVRNVVFEPTERTNAVEIALAQVSAAFRLNKPAIISSHRVNFCGLIKEENRNVGLNGLKKLLKAITVKYPDVEFISSEEFVKLLTNGE